MGYQAHCVVMEEISRASGMDPIEWLAKCKLTCFLKQEALPSPTPHTPSFVSTSSPSMEPPSRRSDSFLVSYQAKRSAP